ncbi:hypothetical protein AB4876_15150 [Zhongshania guokunii]|jgi:Cu/Ag efflux pump CusA|uniref:Uncharacterized protein n=1 Tax=Zhongshania guokunii TaxID=641783 RepID=A0ABV3U9Z1_9GAMM
MTGLALIMGLVPIILSNDSGADLTKRAAAPMLGGVATSLIMSFSGVSGIVRDLEATFYKSSTGNQILRKLMINAARG